MKWVSILAMLTLNIDFFHRYLQELNPAVKGEAHMEVSQTSVLEGNNIVLTFVQDPALIIKTNPRFFLSFALIILSNVEPYLENQIAEILWEGMLLDLLSGLM